MILKEIEKLLEMFLLNMYLLSKIIFNNFRSNQDHQLSTSLVSIPHLKSPPDFVRRRPAAFQLKKV